MYSGVLPDGTAVSLAPIQATDAARLLRFHQTLSGNTTYLRFFAYHPELSPAELHRFTNVDHHDREAIVACVGGEIVGVARFDRVDIRTDAEVALVVADAWRGRAIGKLLFEELVRRGRAEGVERFIAETLAHNSRMLALFDHCGLPHSNRADGDTVMVTIDLTVPPLNTS
ncbi:MAG: GNAT family N-acetyltransferase [Mycobacteriales bacterium]